MEFHPHIHLFEQGQRWKYIIIGTFPPNTSIRSKLYIDYFYGNKGFLWKIIHDLYKDQGYNFFAGSMQENLAEIQRWQQDYCVGLTDTIVRCSRKHPLSSNDSDLIDIGYNYSLKDYVLRNSSTIVKLIFTSSYGKNSAFENFKVIMNGDLALIREKLVIGLPSPSGSANITFFNTWNEKTLGLTEDFYSYVKQHHPDQLPRFEERWRLKKLKRSGKGNNADIVIPASPAGLVKAYKLFRYRQALPSEKCT